MGLKKKKIDFMKPEGRADWEASVNPQGGEEETKVHWEKQPDLQAI